MIRWHEIAANRRALAYILFSVVVLTAMVVVGILPVRREAAKTERRARVLEARLEEQKVFGPLYTSLKQGRDESGLLEAVPGGGPDGRKPFTIDNAPSILSSMAESAGLERAVFTPDPGSLARASDLLLIKGDLGGGYPAFGDFLAELVVCPAFHSVEWLEIRSGRHAPEYALKVWMKTGRDP